MNRALSCLCLLMLSAAPKFCAAQDNANTEAKPKGEATTPIKIQVVFAEFDREKKTKSLPYTIYHNTTHGSLLQADFTKLRLNTPFRIPVGPKQFSEH
jgi:hypothetical protein